MIPSRKQYETMVKKASPPSKSIKNCTLAFTVGGLICVIGQLLMYMYEKFGLSEKQIKMAVPVTLIVLASLLTGIGVFDKIAKHAGAGTLVPITGFSNALTSPAVEFKNDERDIIGLSRKAP